jgi:hypothetical protein
MGYAFYEITRNGETIQAGYGVEAECEEEGCTEQIDRGLGCLCGMTPGGDEHGCGGYYCGKHLFMGPNVDTDLCARCTEAADKARKEAQRNILA